MELSFQSCRPETGNQQQKLASEMNCIHRQALGLIERTLQASQCTGTHMHTDTRVKCAYTQARQMHMESGKRKNNKPSVVIGPKKS